MSAERKGDNKNPSKVAAMDNMATGFAFGMGGDDFGGMDFQTSMAGEGEGGGQPPGSLMPSMGQFPPFNQAVGRDALFPPQPPMMAAPRVSAMELPRFSGGGGGGGGAYGGGINSMSSSGFSNPLMSSRLPFGSAGGMSGFADMFHQQQVSGSEGRGGGGGGGGMMEGLTDQMPPGFGAVMSAASPSLSSPSVLPSSSMPVFPNTPSSALMHAAVGVGHKDGERGGVKGLHPEQKGALQSPPIQSPPPHPSSLQTCFPGQMAPPMQQLHQQHSGSSSSMPPHHHHHHHQQHHHLHQHQQQQQPGRSPSQPRAAFKEEKDFSGGPCDPMPPLLIGSEVTPMQRRRQSPRRAAMAAQEMAAAAAAALAIETKQVPMPPMLSTRDSHLLGSIPHGVGFPPQSMAGGTSAAPLNASAPQQGLQVQRGVQAGFPGQSTGRRRGRPLGSYNNPNQHRGHLRQAQFEPPPAEPGTGLFPQRRTVVPFFKAGTLSLREPEVFECLGRKMPLVTQGTQTGQDWRQEEELVGVGDRPYLPADPKYARVDPWDGKGGFPLRPPSPPPPPPQPQQPFHERARRGALSMVGEGGVGDEGGAGAYRTFTEGEGYAKRGNSKTVVSPSFGEAAGRAVMTTCVGDNATVVTVAIMSWQSSVLRPRVTASSSHPLLSPGTSAHPGDDDLKENVMTPASPANDLDSSTNQDRSPPSGVQTRRGRRLTSAATSAPTISSRGRTLRRRTNPDNISIEDDANFDLMMEERKEKAQAAEQERLEVRWGKTYVKKKSWFWGKCRIKDVSGTIIIIIMSISLAHIQS